MLATLLVVKSGVPSAAASCKRLIIILCISIDKWFFSLHTKNWLIKKNDKNRPLGQTLMMLMANMAMSKTIQKLMCTLSMVISKTLHVKWKKNWNDLAIFGKKWVFWGIQVFMISEGKQQQKKSTTVHWCGCTVVWM